MDARITRSLETYKLINQATGKVEASGLGRIGACDERNLLWARGIKTDMVAE